MADPSSELKFPIFFSVKLVKYQILSFAKAQFASKRKKKIKLGKELGKKKKSRAHPLVHILIQQNLQLCASILNLQSCRKLQTHDMILLVILVYSTVFLLSKFTCYVRRAVLIIRCSDDFAAT